MIKLNLETKNKEQEILKAYLEENASETLADKINNGVKIHKDNKTLINKKTLDTFMKYAYEEARKLAEKGANCACLEDKTVFAWAMHYFEEDLIEGILYNKDGSEYKITPSTPPKQIETPKPKKENNQRSFFDMLDLSTNTQENENNTEEKEEFVEEVKQEPKQEKTETVNVDIHNQTFDKFLLKTISALLDGKVKLQ